MPLAGFHSIHWQVGWSLILLGFLAGALLGLRFHQAGFLGGYDALPRRMGRLGHIALVMLGLLNILYALGPHPIHPTAAMITSICWILGAFLMPTVCFLTAWRTALRHLFVVPVILLLVAALFTLWGGPS
jgi:hypothetical protein